MAPENLISMLAASMVDDAFHQHGARFKDIDMAERKAEEAASRRNEAASWLRKTVGVVAGKELPEQPSGEDFRLGLRSGYILCTAINRVQPGAIPKVVACPGDSVDDSVLLAYQYFENVRNFLVVAREIGVPVFEACDLEKGGNGARVVNSVLGLKSYSEWRQSGGNGIWRYGGNTKPTTNTGNFFIRKNSDPFQNSLSRNQSVADKFLDDHNQNINSSSLNAALLHAIGSEKNSNEALPKMDMAESVLEKLMDLVMQEFDRRVLNQADMDKVNYKIIAEQSPCPLPPPPPPPPPKRKVLAEMVGRKEVEVGGENNEGVQKELVCRLTSENDFKKKLEKQSAIFQLQENNIKELKCDLHSAKASIYSMQNNYSEELCKLGKHLDSVTRAASGYHKVLEDNRRLYNEIQELKGSIRVYCRVRPFLHEKPNPISTVCHLDDGSISISTIPSKNGKEVRKSFSFNKVFGSLATQDEVFSDTQPVVRSVLDGYNVCIFAYGQTGSGKTFTMSGPKEITEESQGVNYRALGDLFSYTQQRREAFHYDISVQMIEIYNEQVRDLLSTDGNTKKLEIRNNSQMDLNVPDANVVPVSCSYDVIQLMNIGQKNRAVSSTSMNDRSSRSHSCLTVHVQGKELASGTLLRGRMHLVDLAGSERVNKSEVTGDRLKEAQHINKSLSALGDVIFALAQKNPHVPYRNSKLTQLLQDSLGGHAKTLMFVHISPETDAVGETISTLKFAERVSTVELGAARLNKDSSEVKELKDQIASLEDALANKNTPMKQKTRIAKSPNKNLGKKPNQDFQELLPNGIDSAQSYEDWVDKVMVNKLESNSFDRRPEDSMNQTHLPDFFYPGHRKLYSGNVISRTRSESATIDDSDEFDIATIDSSSDNGYVGGNVDVLMIKKAQSRIPQSPIKHTVAGPSPSKRVGNNGSSLLQTPTMTGRRPPEYKRSTSGGGKTVSRK